MEWFVVARWLVGCLLLGALGLPLAAWLCPSLPRRGATVALPLSLVVVGLLTYWLGKLSFGLPVVVGAVLLLALASGLAYRSGAPVDVRGYGEIAAVFVGGFGLVVVVRATDPGVFPGAENFLNVGLLQSLLRAPSLPPEDMWFAGERIRYYYGGHLLAAVLAKLTATPGRLAYNLAFAVFYGTLLSTAYGAGRAIVADASTSGRLAGGLAAFFVGVSSNLLVPIQYLLGILPDTVATPIAGTLGLSLARLGQPDIYDPVHFSFTNTDFPMYSLLLGTLHAHVMSTTVLAFLVVLLLAYYRTPGTAIRRRWTLVAVAGLVVGYLALVNTWSLPTGLGLVAVTLWLSPAAPRSIVPGRSSPDTSDRTGASTLQGIDVSSLAFRAGAALVVTSVAGVLAVVAVAPFMLRGTPGGVGLGVLPDRSPWHFYVLAYGSFLAVAALVALPRLHATLQRSARRRALAVAAGLLVLGLLLGFPALFLVLPVGLGGLSLRRVDADVGYETVLLVAGAGLVLVVEVLYVAEPAEPGRFNTVYKTFMQAWIVWGIAAGALLARALDQDDGPVVRALGGRSRLETVSVLLVAALSIYAAVWTGGAVTAAASGADMTLDGFAPLEQTYPDRLAGVNWLATQDGRPRLVSAPAMRGSTYTINGSPAASLTGLPTLVGWVHERDYRGAAAFERRVAVVDEIYTGSPEERAELLAQYDVAFVWVGPAERARYDGITLSPGEEPWLSVAYEEGSVRIYAVDRDDLPTA